MVRSPEEEGKSKQHPLPGGGQEEWLKQQNALVSLPYFPGFNVNWSYWDTFSAG